MNGWRLLCVGVLLALGAACRPGGAGTETADQVYEVRGVVKRFTPGEKRIVIDHEEIQGYMDAMTMPFNLRSADDAAGLVPGDRVRFKLHVTEDRSWITDIAKIEDAPDSTGETNSAAATPPQRPPVRLVRYVEPLSIGEVVPDYPFTNELGKPIRLSDFSGQALALTFIFTRCPMPDFCPMMSRKFAEAYELLTKDPNAPTNWHLLTISFDPHFDTPNILRSYAQRYSYDPAKWSFITGAMIDIDAITEQFEMTIFKQGEQWDHKLRTVVLGPDRTVRQIFVYNQWTAQQLADALTSAAKNLPPDAGEGPDATGQADSSGG